MNLYFLHTLVFLTVFPVGAGEYGHRHESGVAITSVTRDYRISGIWPGSSGTYYYEADDTILTNAPEWLPSEQSPPLAPRDALRIARSFAEKTWSGYRWNLEKICLEPSDSAKQAETDWFYVVSFTPVMDGNLDGNMGAESVVVLMNGRVPRIIHQNHNGEKEQSHESGRTTAFDARYYRTSGIWPGKGGGTYYYEADDSILTNAPEWLPSEQSPPLAPRDALRIARSFAEKTWSGYRWSLKGICLEPSDPAKQDESHWFYVVSYRRVLNANSDGLIGAASVVVLMNGKVASIHRDGLAK